MATSPCSFRSRIERDRGNKRSGRASGKSGTYRRDVIGGLSSRLGFVLEASVEVIHDALGSLGDFLLQK